MMDLKNHTERLYSSLKKLKKNDKQYYKIKDMFFRIGWEWSPNLVYRKPGHIQLQYVIIVGCLSLYIIGVFIKIH